VQGAAPTETAAEAACTVGPAGATDDVIPSTPTASRANHRREIPALTDAREFRRPPLDPAVPTARAVPPPLRARPRRSTFQGPSADPPRTPDPPRSRTRNLLPLACTLWLLGGREPEDPSLRGPTGRQSLECCSIYSLNSVQARSRGRTDRADAKHCWRALRASDGPIRPRPGRRRSITTSTPWERRAATCVVGVNGSSSTKGVATDVSE
jgi:hypothetical protein